MKNNSKVHILDHPLIRHKVAIIRNKETDTKQFREIIKEIAMLMLEYARKHMVVAPDETRTLEEIKASPEFLEAQKNIDELKGNMLAGQYRNFVLEERCKAYESLLKKIDSMVRDKE